MPSKSGRRRRSSPNSSPPRKPFWRRALRALVLWGGGLAILGVIFLATAVMMTARELPGYTTLKTSQNGQMVVVRARDGSELVTLGPSYGRWIPYDEIPPVMRDAMVSVEDRRFYSHWGVDPLGLARAVYMGLTGDRRISATSTITQQLARNVFLNNNRSYARKVREGVLALALEQKFSKEQILELYLNKVYFGGGAYGIDAASRKFFGHPANELSLPEAAIIAGLVKAPSHYSPTADVNAAVTRGQVVLRLMAEQGKIGYGDAQAIDLDTVRIAKEAGQNSVRYFTDWALPQLDMLIPSTTEPIEVWTTLDPKMQASATDAIKNNVPSGTQGALVAMDRDGAVLALVGGTDYVTSNYNRAVNAVRQPGSAWKLFVYLAALEAGYTPADRVVDEPVTIDGWSPHNSGRNYAGPIDVRTAFAYSKNTVAASLGNEVGFGTVASMARRFGITTPITTLPSMVLGTSEVRLIDMTRAFAAVSAGGSAIEPYGITKVETSSGRVLYQHEHKRGQLLVPQYVAAGITDLLQSAVATGTGRAAQIGRPVAGKTGTTSSNKDGWFLGFSSGVTTGVWMGRDDAKPVPGLSGGRAPAAAFAQFMRAAVKNRPVEQFDTELQLPEWQLEPDDEYFYGDPDDYYYGDESGNMIEPGTGGRGPGDGMPRYDDGTVGPGPGPGEAPPAAASDDFLDRALGRNQGDPGLRPGQGTGTQPLPTVRRGSSPAERQQPPPPQPLMPQGQGGDGREYRPGLY
ncbi:PBP1A family penicillin-binding protein [Novosphingobium sp. PC22D]|uniref:transglycosylase domain-containing protein n=1 Tax=Novosphingobium sp. PC22D TaxID=1962403 RepID=UPI000BEF5291|nr:PBP1A family penicillin-binding protein [Novosphingobium sp. PC22D]